MKEIYKRNKKEIEQLEKENKELKQPQVFIDCENMEERYGRDLYEDYLKEKIEQLEECIDYIKHEIKDMPLNDCKLRLINLLNILNKGSDE